jgi:zinc finger protein
MQSNSEVKKTEILFENIDGGQQISEIESLCMNCHQQGTTKMLITKIPHFRELVLMSFDCPFCFNSNCQIQPCASIAELGLKIKCEMKTLKVLLF